MEKISLAEERVLNGESNRVVITKAEFLKRLKEQDKSLYKLTVNLSDFNVLGSNVNPFVKAVLDSSTVYLKCRKKQENKMQELFMSQVDDKTKENLTKLNRMISEKIKTLNVDGWHFDINGASNYRDLEQWFDGSETQSIGSSYHIQRDEARKEVVGEDKEGNYFISRHKDDINELYELYDTRQSIYLGGYHLKEGSNPDFVNLLVWHNKYYWLERKESEKFNEKILNRFAPVVSMTEETENKSIQTNNENNKSK